MSNTSIPESIHLSPEEARLLQEAINTVSITPNPVTDISTPESTNNDNSAAETSAPVSETNESDSPETINTSAPTSDESPTPELISNEIPLNPEHIVIEDKVSRFQGAPWFKGVQESYISVMGLGGIGSWTALLTSRLNPKNINLFDQDIVEEVNMSGQLYSMNSVGSTKSREIANFIRSYSNYYVLDTYGNVTEHTNHSVIYPICICGFDSMDARRIAFNLWKDNATNSISKNKYVFIDGRLAAEEFQIYCISGDRQDLIDKYEKTALFADSEAEQTQCSYKQTSFCAAMIASFIISILVNSIYNLTSPDIPRFVPYFTYYNAELMMLKTE